jgi:glycosyltransferase EpsF
LKVLQLVENLNTGAVESWLVRMLAASRANGSESLNWTFFCTLGKPGRLDDQARSLGAEIIYSPVEIGDKRAFFCHLRNVIKQGQYDVLHCHHDFISAVYLCASLGSSVRKRIVHIHNTDEGLLTPSRLKALLLKEPMRQTCLRLADNIVGISRQTLSQFTHDREPRPGRDFIVHYGVDTSLFHQPLSTCEQFRESLGFASTAKVLLFVGRMATLKNPLFVVEILAELSKSDPDVVAIFAGAGPLERDVMELSAKYGVADKVRILGWSDDTASLMRQANVFIFPRLEEPKEGLGLVLVEAQAAGIPIVASPSITDDVVVIPELFDIVPLSAGPAVWAKHVKAALLRTDISRVSSLARIESSSFSLDAGVKHLLALYSLQN